MKLDLPPTGTGQPPAFADAGQCAAWLKTLPLSSPLQTQAQLLRQLQLLDRYTLDAELRLALLETLRETVYFAQTECAKKFSGRPLPLAPPEQAAFDSAQGLWLALLAGYTRCIDACLGADTPLRLQAGMICQRALATLADAHADMVRAGLRPPPTLWRQAHLLYVCAEALGRAATACDDALRGSRPQTPGTAYTELMLTQAAGLQELALRQQQWVMRWARRWADKVTIHDLPPALDTPALPLCVDLDGEAPAGFQPQSGKGARWLDTTELRKSLKKRLTLLTREGAAADPVRLGLGDDCPQPACGEVLRRTYPRWVKGGVLRRHERHPLSGACRCVVGVDAIHYYVSDRQPFKPPGNVTAEELRRQREELATFDRIAERFDDEYSRNHGYQFENWEIVEDWGMLDQSSGGLRIVRPLEQAGGRLGSGQLIAVQPAGAAGLLLGAVRWAQVGGDSLSAGIKLFPGRPVAIVLRGTGVMAAKEQFYPGFLIPPTDALEMPASIVLPPGAFKPNRIMEVWHLGVSRRIRLGEVLDRGGDFERAAFKEISA